MTKKALQKRNKSNYADLRT